MLNRILSTSKTIALAITFLAAACGPQSQPLEVNPAGFRQEADGPEIEVRPARAKRAEPRSFEDLRFVRYQVGTEGDAPVACLSFSDQLSGRFDYSTYIDVGSDQKPALTTRGSELCIGGLSFGESAEITLLKGLPAADKQKTLQTDETIQIDFGDRPSYVGFRGSGVVLPRLKADGIAFETVNVDAVKVTVSHVSDRSIVFKTITSGYRAGRGEYFWRDEASDPSDLSEPTWSGVVDIDSQPNTSTVSVFSMASATQQLEPGAYYVELAEVTNSALEETQPARAGRWIIVTDLALTAYHGADRMMVRTRSIDSAKVARNVRLDLIARNNEILATRMTDGRGLASFEAPLLKGKGPSAPRMLMAYDETGDYAILDLDRPEVDLSNENISGRSPPEGIEAWLYTDRGIYRPGETVHVSAMLRDASALAVKNRSGDVRIIRPNGIEARTWRFEDATEAGALYFDYQLPEQAARGQWRIETRIDGIGLVGSQRISVEDFVPQRVELKLSADTETPLGIDESRSIETNVRFLYGAPGAGLTVESRARVEVHPNPFPRFEGFSFGQHDESFRERELDMPDATADGNGDAVLQLDPRPAALSSTRPLRLRTVVTAIEPGGRPVSDDLRIGYNTREDFLGVRPVFDGRAQDGAEANFELVSVDGVTGDLRGAIVDWELVRIDWEYDWYRDGGGQWKWRRTRHVVPVENGSTELGGAGPTSLVTRELDWGDYQLILANRNTGAKASYPFWAGWGGGPQEGTEAPDRVRISAPDEAVTIGGKAVFTILPPYAGEAEIVVANDHIIEQRTVSVSEKGLKLDFNVTEEWGSGAYVMVSVFTPRDPLKRPRPRRAVGVAYADVDISQRQFAVSMTAPERVEPRQRLTLQLEASGGPRGENIFATVAAIDEGILQLTKFESPDPSSFFFARRKLGVRLLDDYGRLLDPNEGAATMPRSGGDQIGGAGLSVVPTKTVALFSGLIPVGRDGQAEVSFDVPDFNGELRLMAVVWSDTGMGSAARPITVRDDVPTELILPRFLAPGDNALATATIDNVSGATGNYRLSVVGLDGLSSSMERTELALETGNRQDLEVPISADEEGVSSVRINLSGPNELRLTHDYDLELRSPYWPESRVERVTLASGDSYSPPADLLEGLQISKANLRINASPIPLDAAALYDSLDRYPYGCTEQTISRALPLLYAPDLARIGGRDADQDIRFKVQKAVSTILNRQGLDGAIGLWRMGDRQSSPWLGAYAVDFLSRAKERGYTVPQAALDSAVGALSHIAEDKRLWDVGYDYDVYESNWNNDTSQRLKTRAAAYAAYVLAREGKIEASRLRYLHDELLQETDSPLARAHIGASLAMIGDRARARSAMQAAVDALGYDNNGDYYQTPRRDMAGVLSLAAESKLSDIVSTLTEQVSLDIPEPEELTTQEKAFLLMAANALGASDEVEMSLSGNVDTLIGNRSYQASALQFGDAPPVLSNDGEGDIYLTVTARGSPVEAPVAVSEGLVLRKSISKPDGTSADLSSVEQGDRLIISLSVSGESRRLHPVIIADLLPAGFEIETVLNDGGSNPYPRAQDLTYAKLQEARDDRFIAAVDIVNRRAARLAYIVRAVTPGDFAMPGAVAEDMYRTDLFARTASTRVVIEAAN